ncbi:MAG TPA: AAA family ATPase, partial [Burkholderiaceae bacterium]|nr:AAA family ATPase [Burkholderiaceae bacterium]
MLACLRLRDFVIVDRVELELGSGFTVLTGETGAGKSILLDALGLALGDRADAAVVRDGAERADICAEFRIDDALERWLGERALGGDPGQLQLRRVIEADGRSRAFINGNPATAALLREAGAALLEIHGQHASQSLLRTEGQRALLDRIAGTADAIAQLADRFAALRALERDLEQARNQSREQALERERLQWQVDEIAQLRMHDGEWDELGAEQKRLAHAAALLEGARAAADALRDADDALGERVHHLMQRLRPLAAIDASLAEPVQLLEQAAIQIDEAASALAGYAERVDLDPQRLTQVEQRLSEIHAAARKLRMAPERLPAELAELQQRLQRLIDAQDAAALEARIASARREYDALAQRISEQRQAAAARLAGSVSERLGRLGMKGARLE